MRVWPHRPESRREDPPDTPVTATTPGGFQASTPTDPREAAWFAVHDALPAYWMVGPVTFDPSRGQFSVTARAPHPGRGRIPVTVSGADETENAALVDLHGRLTGMPRPADDAAKRELLNRRLRLAFYGGAEESGRSGGRRLSEGELERVLSRYPGDM
jgi:hypothetical protein